MPKGSSKETPIIEHAMHKTEVQAINAKIHESCQSGIKEFTILTLIGNLSMHTKVTFVHVDCQTLCCVFDSLSLLILSYHML